MTRELGRTRVEISIIPSGATLEKGAARTQVLISTTKDCPSKEASSLTKARSVSAVVESSSFCLGLVSNSPSGVADETNSSSEIGDSVCVEAQQLSSNK